MEWIKVEDRLPEHNERVLVCISDQLEVAFFDGKEEENKHWWIAGFYFALSEITHWAKIEPPEQT